MCISKRSTWNFLKVSVTKLIANLPMTEFKRAPLKALFVFCLAQFFFHLFIYCTRHNVHIEGKKYKQLMKCILFSSKKKRHTFEAEWINNFFFSLFTSNEVFFISFVDEGKSVFHVSWEFFSNSHNSYCAFLRDLAGRVVFPNFLFNF